MSRYEASVVEDVAASGLSYEAWIRTRFGRHERIIHDTNCHAAPEFSSASDDPDYGPRHAAAADEGLQRRRER